MFVKYLKDQILVKSPTCGELREIITAKDYNPLGIAVATDIKPTQAHFHNTFDEIYFVLDGDIILEIYDPTTAKITSYHLQANELFVVSKKLHHKITKASESNRLCVISTPPFHADDEHPSDKL